jgi:hypothetical protein
MHQPDRSKAAYNQWIIKGMERLLGFIAAHRDDQEFCAVVIAHMRQFTHPTRMQDHRKIYREAMACHARN